MRHTEQVRLIKQLCAQIDSGTTVDAGGVVRMSTTAYTDPVLAEREWQEFFVGMPHCIGLSGDLPEIGSFITNNDLGIPILATRDQDGSFKVFVNSCRHRGVIVETQERGTTRRFTCPFHAWSYDT
ncbi:MAG: Rieske (2Fe-2S) protein, partial [Actinomycetes bacterium]